MRVIQVKEEVTEKDGEDALAIKLLVKRIKQMILH